MLSTIIDKNRDAIAGKPRDATAYFDPYISNTISSTHGQYVT